MRSIARVEDVSINTVTKLLIDAGEACRKFHNRQVRYVKIADSVQCDELWSFVYAKDKAVEKDKLVSPPDVVGSVWTFTAIDSTSKLLLSCLVRKYRNTRSAIALFRDLRIRIEDISQHRHTICTDKLEAYQLAADKVFWNRVTLTQERKGKNSQNNTAHVERHNLTIRMANRRYTRKTNAFSKMVENHVAHMHLFSVYYNFCRLHETLQISPAMEAGIIDTLYDVDFIVDLVNRDARYMKPGPRVGTKYEKRKST